MYDVVLEKIIQFISDTPSIRNILDVGCGEGFYARADTAKNRTKHLAFDLSREGNTDCIKKRQAQSSEVVCY